MWASRHIDRGLRCTHPASSLGARENLSDLFGCNANGTVRRNSRTSQQRGEQVALVSLHVRQESPRVDRTATFACDDEGQVGSRVSIAIFKARTPHHDAVVQQRAVAFSQAVHLFHHVGELLDVERRDCGYFSDLLRIVIVVRRRMMLVFEPEFRVRDSVGRRTDVGADPRRVGLKR
jgi:hypothetical protein